MFTSATTSSVRTLTRDDQNSYESDKILGKLFRIVSVSDQRASDVSADFLNFRHRSIETLTVSPSPMHSFGQELIIACPASSSLPNSCALLLSSNTSMI
jgi:hypothetical protein